MRLLDRISETSIGLSRLVEQKSFPGSEMATGFM